MSLCYAECRYAECHHAECRCAKTLQPVMFYGTGPGACIIKRITAVIYGFRNKLECLSLASISSLVKRLGTNTLAYYGNCKLQP